MCLPFSIIKDRPELKEAFLMCGCDPSRGEVGIILERSFWEIAGRRILVGHLEAVSSQSGSTTPTPRAGPGAGPPMQVERTQGAP